MMQKNQTMTGGHAQRQDGHEGGNSSIYRNVTSSSADVGCMATHESKLALVAPILMATANPCSISSQPWPII